MIPQSFINDLLDRADIVSVIDGRVALKKTGKNYVGLCPFHEEKSPSFSVSPDKQFFHCFGCQESGSALTFLMKFERLEFVEAVEMLAKDLGLEVPRERQSRARESVDQGLYQALEQAEGYYRRQLRSAPVAIEYLKGRGVTGPVARDFGIGYAPDGWHNLRDALGADENKLLLAGLTTKNDKGNVYDRFRDRVVFPIRDTRGRVIGFGGRTLKDGDGPKYLNSPETPLFQKGRELYGLYEARKALRSIDRLIVVEGYMDVVALAQNGIPNAVATLGTATGTAHYEKLYRYSDEVICCFDGDKAGRAAAWRALESALPVLNERRSLKFVFLPNGEDPDSMIRTHGQTVFQEHVNQATPGLEFLLGRLKENLDLHSLDGRAKFMGLAAPYIEKLPQGLLRDMVQARVRELGGLEPVQQSAVSASTREARVSPASQPSATTNRRGIERLQRRMLIILLKETQLWSLLEDGLRAKLAEHATHLGLLGTLVDFLEQNPNAEIDKILVGWPDEATQGELVNLVNQPLEPGLPREREVVDGLGNLCRLMDDELRRQRQLQAREIGAEAELLSHLRSAEGGGHRERTAGD